MLKRVLVALGGTPFTPSAVRYALELAKPDDGIVTGLTLMDRERIDDVGSVPVGGAAAAHELREHRTEIVRGRIEEEIAKFEAACKEAGVRYKLVCEEEDTFRRLEDLWRYHDLTIIGVRGLFDYGVMSSPDDIVARLIDRRVRPILAVAETYRPIHRVLIAYNGTIPSAKALKRYVRMNLWGRSVTLRIVVFNRDDEAETLLRDAADYCRDYGFSVETVHAHVDSPRDALLPFATEWNADLVVMGTVSKREFVRKYILGSVTGKILREAEIPLFLTQ